MSNIRIRGGKFNYIKGDYTVVDHSRHVTNIDSDNIYRTTVANSYNNNFKKIGEQFQLIPSLIQGRLMTQLRCLFCP
jgi:hypothetical protein